jgi:hypothetical protein
MSMIGYVWNWVGVVADEQKILIIKSAPMDMKHMRKAIGLYFASLSESPRKFSAYR